jgi:hypothetical protein
MIRPLPQMVLSFKLSFVAGLELFDSTISNPLPYSRDTQNAPGELHSLNIFDISTSPLLLVQTKSLIAYDYSDIYTKQYL